MKLIKGIALLSSAAVLAGCLDDSDEKAPVVSAPATYTFTNVVDGTDDSSVSYTGQSTRQLLINDLKALISTDDLYVVTQDAAGKAQVIERLNRVYANGTKDVVTPELNLLESNVFTDAAEVTPISLSVASPLTLSKTIYSELSTEKNLKSKLAGQDNDLSNDFIGWDITLTGDETANDKPALLIQSWFAAIAELATDNVDATTYVSAEGLDYQQLIQKFLLGAVNYSQAAEDYLKPSKGLLAQNTTGDKDNTKAYTALEHQWDEGFGYFGAARDYNSRTDVETKTTAYNDTNEDGVIDVYSEYSYGHSINASKRDAGATDAGTDFSKAAMDAFLAGRQFIQDFTGTDTTDGSYEHRYLAEYAETALNNWENAIASTVIHYVNDVIAETEGLGTQAEASFSNRAKHWSEMKGFALNLQFSPIAQISMTDLASVHALMGEAPVLAAGDAADAYVVKLKEARDLLQAAYGFSDTNVANW